MNEARNKLISDIQHGDIKGSLDIAKGTAEYLQLIISKTEWKVASEILEAVSEEGRQLVQALPQHAPVSNVVLQLLHVIREEYRTAITKTRPAMQAVQRFLEGASGLRSEEERYTVSVEGLQEAVMDHVAEFLTELELSTHNVAEQAGEHIHAGDVVMTVGRSAMVEALLLSKAQEDKKPNFEVIVVEGAPFCQGHTMASNLAKKGVPTTLVPDSNVFALMPRVNKVILGTNLVLGDGGLRAVTGSHTIALAAKHHAVPVVVLAPSYKFSPRCGGGVNEDRASINIHASPQGVLNFSEMDFASDVRVHNPVFDFVPPEYVTLLISNMGSFDSSFVYLILRDLYGSSEENTATLEPR